jgi:hypothetical protein
MRARNIIVLGTVAILAGAAALTLFRLGIEPVKVRLVGTQTLSSSGSRVITLEFTRSEESGVYLDGDPSVQLRLAEHWQALLKLPKIDLLSETNQQRIVLAVPLETKACRFLVCYRVYQQQPNRPYCRVYSFLQKHGLRAKYPKISGLVLRCFVPRLRHSSLEVTLPPSAEVALGVMGFLAAPGPEHVCQSGDFRGAGTFSPVPAIRTRWAARIAQLEAHLFPVGHQRRGASEFWEPR